MSKQLPDELLAQEARRTDQAMLGLTRRSQSPSEVPLRTSSRESPIDHPSGLSADLPADLVNGIPLDALSIADWSGFADAPILEWPPRPGPVSNESAQSEPPKTPGFLESFGWE